MDHFFGMISCLWNHIDLIYIYIYIDTSIQFVWRERKMYSHYVIMSTKNDMFHWCLTFLLYAKNRVDLGITTKVSSGVFHPAPWLISVVSLFGVSKSLGSWWKWFTFCILVHFEVTWFSGPHRNSSEPEARFLMLEKLWAAKIKIEKNFLELSFILILLLFIKIPLLCFFKKLWKNLSLQLQVGWMLLVFRLGNSIGGHSRETAPLFIFHRPNNKTSRHEDCNHPSIGIGICQRAHQGERRIIILMKYMADDR